MHHSFVEALLRYLINENDLSKNPNWRRSAFNTLFLAVLHHMCRLKNACAHPTSQSVVVPFSRQDFVRVFCYEFTHWRCGREDGDTSKTPIVWDTQQSRMLSMDTFGVSRVITISDSGSIPIAEIVVEADRSRVLSRLSNDDFPICICTSSKSFNALKLICMKLVVKYLLETRVGNTREEIIFPKELLLTTVAKEYVVDGIKFEDFFDSHEKAKEYIANKCKSEKFTGKSIREDSVYTGNVVAFWDKVFANCVESPIFYLGWLKTPGPTPRPIFSLFDGFPIDVVNNLNAELADGNHQAAMNIVATDGVITEQLVQYLMAKRRIWELNRYTVALKLDSDGSVAPTKEEVDANVNFMKSFNATRYLASALIKPKN
jgi:hypothetical protein